MDHVSCPWLVQRFILEAVLDGRRVMHFADDQAQREASIPVLDALYAGKLAGRSATEDGGGGQAEAAAGPVPGAGAPGREATVAVAPSPTGPLRRFACTRCLGAAGMTARA